MPTPVLTVRSLNRALLARQLLLERADLSIPDALAQVGGLQTQYAPSGYVGLWTRLADFRRGALMEALEDRTAVQATGRSSSSRMVAARWQARAGAIAVEPLRALSADEEAAVERERAAPEAFHGG